MAAQRLGSSHLRCRGCQSYVIQSFISRLATFIPEARVPSTSRFPLNAQAFPQKRASFGRHSRPISTTRLFSSRPQSTGQNVDQTQSTAVDTSSVPWYLRDGNRPIEPDTNPFSERQRLPDLPPNPPPILPYLLRYISVELGLDYLSLLDLRSLDPPPALGANLLMLVGTARSEKHLNVSSDRLCRMLRTEYKLSPQADGLLGRNELKLKLRRKNRRSKMLGAVGARERIDADDGIRTGWVCVNVGQVANSTETTVENSKSNEQDFVGFGKHTYGTNIVVQLLTEEKRVEIDLEGLWQGALDRAEKKAAKELETSDNINISEESGVAFTESNGANIERSQSSSSPQHVSAGSVYQVRNTHTLRSKVGITSKTSKSHTSHVACYSSSSRAAVFQVDEKTDPNPTLRTQRHLLDNLKRLSDPVAFEALGINENDTSSTTFLTSFHCQWPNIPDVEAYNCLIELQCFALRIEHRGYTKGRLMWYLTRMEADNVVVPEATFLLAFETILLTPYYLDEEYQEKRGGFDALHAFRRDLGRAFDILEKMEMHGHQILQDAVFLTLHRAVCNPALYTTGPFFPGENSSREMRMFKNDILTHQNHLRKVMHQLYEPQSDEVYMEMLHSYGQQLEWNGFWEIWREMAIAMRPRSPQMYAFMFRTVAGQKHEAECQQALREHVEEMNREVPVVRFEGDVAISVLQCLIAANAPADDPFWAALWQKCRMAVPELFAEAVPSKPEHTK